MQDKFAMFDIASSLIQAGASGTGFGGGVAGAYTSPGGTGGSYDTGAPLPASNTSGTGIPNAVGPTGTIGGPLLHDLGRGRRLLLYVQVVALVTPGTATLEADFICADSADLTVNQTILLRSNAVLVSTMVNNPGYRFPHGSTPGIVPRRFVGMLYTIGVSTITAGSVSAGLMLDVDDHAGVYS